MELWVRSQDKEGIYKVDEIYIDERDYGNDDISYYLRENGVLLGRYATKERALEVLDEIQNLLTPKLILNSAKMVTPVDEFIVQEQNIYETKELSTYVYEMPKE